MKKLLFILILNSVLLAFACRTEDDNFSPIEPPRSGETSQSIAVSCDSLFALGQPSNGFVRNVQVDETYTGANGECRMSVSFYNQLPIPTSYFLELNGDPVAIGTNYDFEIPDSYFTITARWQFTALPITHIYYGVLHSSIRSFDP